MRKMYMRHIWREGRSERDNDNGDRGGFDSEYEYNNDMTTIESLQTADT